MSDCQIPIPFITPPPPTSTSTSTSTASQDRRTAAKAGAMSVVRGGRRGESMPDFLVEELGSQVSERSERGLLPCIVCVCAVGGWCQSLCVWVCAMSAAATCLVLCVP